MMVLVVGRSENVEDACSACGGGEGGFVRRDGPEGHADWCPYVSDVIWDVFQWERDGIGTKAWQVPSQRAVSRADVRPRP